MPAGVARQPASWRGTPENTPPPKTGAAPGVYRRHRPEATALYEVVRDNLEYAPAFPSMRREREAVS